MTNDYVTDINVGEMAESEEEPAEWIVNTDESRRWDRVRFYCSSCNGEPICVIKYAEGYEHIYRMFKEDDE